MYQLVDSMRHDFAVEKICDALPVTKSGYYEWKKNPVSKCEESDLTLLKSVTAIHTESRERFGSPRILNKLNEMGQFPNHKRVERIMRDNDIRSKAAKKFKVTTNSNHDKNISPNLLRRDFDPPAESNPSYENMLSRKTSVDYFLF